MTQAANEFLSTGDDTDFALIAGIDTAGAGGTQTKFRYSPVASFVSTNLSANSNALKRQTCSQK